MLTVGEQAERAASRIEEAERRQRAERRQAREKARKRAQRQNYVVGELVCKYFPQLRQIEPGTIAENAQRYAQLDAILRAIETNPELLETLTGEHRSGANIPQ